MFKPNRIIPIRCYAFLVNLRTIPCGECDVALERQYATVAKHERVLAFERLHHIKERGTNICPFHQWGEFQHSMRNVQRAPRGNPIHDALNATNFVLALLFSELVDLPVDSFDLIITLLAFAQEKIHSQAKPSEATTNEVLARIETKN